MIEIQNSQYFPTHGKESGPPEAINSWAFIPHFTLQMRSSANYDDFAGSYQENDNAAPLNSFSSTLNAGLAEGTVFSISILGAIMEIHSSL